jgi:hypothetical protein
VSGLPVCALASTKTRLVPVMPTAMLVYSVAIVTSLEFQHVDLSLPREDSAERISNARTIWVVSS